MRTAITGTIAERMTMANNLSLVKLPYSRILLEHKPLMLTDRTVRSARETAPHGNLTRPYMSLKTAQTQALTAAPQPAVPTRLAPPTIPPTRPAARQRA